MPSVLVLKTEMNRWKPYPDEDWYRVYLGYTFWGVPDTAVSSVP
jgi:hypothetical protein